MNAAGLDSLLSKAGQFKDGRVDGPSLIKQMVEYLLSILDKLPEEEFARLSKAVSNKKNPQPRPNEALVAIQKTSHSDFKLSGSMKEEFGLWKQTHGMSFWDRESRAEARADDSQRCENIVSFIYYSLRKAEASFKVFRRFSVVGLHTLAEQVARKRGCEIITPEVFKLFVDLVRKGNIGEDSEDTIESNLRQDIAAGSKYRRYGEMLGGLGCLFHLPGSVPDYMWEQRLPTKGTAFDNAMDHLKKQGICEEAQRYGSHDLASKIVSAIVGQYKIPAIEFQSTLVGEPLKPRKRRRPIVRTPSQEQTGKGSTAYTIYEPQAPPESGRTGGDQLQDSAIVIRQGAGQQVNGLSNSIPHQPSPPSQQVEEVTRMANSTSNSVPSQYPAEVHSETPEPLPDESKPPENEFALI
ncbi:MAG: hypothetical protein M1840_000615 [Geoglossum simile]|nr:MAG: hypothetical protein M1840_000615 [Geoglossum simile]